MALSNPIKAEKRRLREQLEAAFAQYPDAPALRARLEALAAEPDFDGLTWYWGPRAHALDRVVFRPFILAHFGAVERTGPWRWDRVAWRGEAGAALEPWLSRVDAEDDVELTRRLLAWRLGESGNWKAQRQAWRQELARRFRAAPSPAACSLVLAKLDLWMDLDEAAALALYQTDARLAAPFILRHLPFHYGDTGRGLWTGLAEAARKAGDEDFADRLYRRQVKVADWGRDILALARRTADPAELDRTLERHHPEGGGLDLGDGLLALLQARGRDVVPYVRRHLRQVWSPYLGGGSYGKLVTLAHDRGWLDLWAGLLCVGGRPKDYNRAIAELLDSPLLDDTQIQARLRLLSGVSREWNFAGFGLAQVQALEPQVAVRLYDRFPDLVRGPFKAHVAPGWWQAYDALLARALEQADEALTDYLASRLVTRLHWGEGKVIAAAERAAAYYEGLRLDPEAFARRAASVLTQVPAYAIQRYDKLIQENRLARLLFERSFSSYLGDAPSVADLVEASNIHVQHLAYRVLSRDDDRARALARQHLPILLGTLLRPLHRLTRAAAFGALANAASTPETAHRVLERARLAQALPDHHYPKEALLGLIGRILAGYPELAGERERPLVYRRQVA